MNSLLGERQYKWLGLRGCWHLEFYNPADHEPGTISGSILNFKDRNANAVEEWSERAYTDLKASGIQFHCIVRALGSSELQPNGRKALDLLGQYLSKRLESNYLPQILSKSRITKPMHTMKLADRQIEMDNVYIAGPGNYDFNGKNILILDDVTTTNTTLKEILRALKTAWPKANFYFFCLGRTRRVDVTL